MKRILVLIIFSFFSKNTFAQNIDQSKVPAVILNAFQLKHPNADDIEWEKKKENYKIEFREKGKENKLTLNYKGNLLEHSQDLYASEIPKIVLETIKTKAAYFDVQDADKYEKGGKITYRIKFKIDQRYRYTWVNEKGVLLKYTKELKDNEIPSSIMNIITNKYGEIDIDYSKYIEKGSQITYIIRGEINDANHEFKINDKATILKHSEDIKNSKIPSAIIKTIASKYDGYDIRDADVIKDKLKTIYILRMRKYKKQIYVTFTPDGKVLRVK